MDAPGHFMQVDKLSSTLLKLLIIYKYCNVFMCVLVHDILKIYPPLCVIWMMGNAVYHLHIARKCVLLYLFAAYHK